MITTVHIANNRWIMGNGMPSCSVLELQVTADTNLLLNKLLKYKKFTTLAYTS